jgi:transposase
MRRRQFTAELKKEAAGMLIIEAQTAKEVSNQLGVAENLLYRWKKAHLTELEAGKPEGTPSPTEMAREITELRKQLAKSHRMNEILKKTVGYFSKDD